MRHQPDYNEADYNPLIWFIKFVLVAIISYCAGEMHLLSWIDKTFPKVIKVEPPSIQIQQPYERL